MYTSIRLTRISLALNRSRRKATTAAHNMPPATPASRIAITIRRVVSLSAINATPPARIAPITYWPSAPMFHTFDRKHTDRPSAMISSGVALTISSPRRAPELTGSHRNTSSPRTGSLPNAANSATPMTTVSASASSGEATLQARDGSGRCSSRSNGSLPQAAHPLADALHGRVAPCDRRRHAAFRDHVQAIADLEQLLELLADHEHRAARVAQREQLAAD